MDASWWAEHAGLLGLVAARLAGVAVTGPVFASPEVPLLARGAFALVLSLLVLPVVAAAPVPDPGAGWVYAPAVVAEAAFGVAVGLLGQLIVLAVHGAGELLDFELGFGIGQLLNPDAERPGSLVGSWLHVLTLVVFLGINGHHVVLRALLETFEAIPPGAVHLPPPAAASAARLLGWVVLTAFRLALPVLAVMALVTVGLAVLARVLPQLNVFLTGLPAKLALGVAVLAVAAPAVAAAVRGFSEEALGLMLRWLGEVAP